jgi:predicted glycogen debranching enzyme
MATADAEWLEADGSGGFASGTVGGARTRRYHALLLAATAPPAGRTVLVNGLEAWATTASGTSPLSTQHYAPDVVWPPLAEGSVAFSRAPWPVWLHHLADGTQIAHEMFLHRQSGRVVLRWTRVRGEGACSLGVRLLLSGRDYHALHRENAAFRFDADLNGGNVAWHPYDALPAIAATTNGQYKHAPDWYRNFLYTAERERGLDHIEDLASPGVFTFDLPAAGPAVIVLQAGAADIEEAGALAQCLDREERARRLRLPRPLALSAQSYRVVGGRGETVIAGFPWFTDWGRDTFIALRGLVLALGDLEAAEAILCGWAGSVSEGMLPNRFPDHGETPEYNAVDASLWFIVAVHDFLQACDAAQRPCPTSRVDTLRAACEAVVAGYTQGTRYRIGVDTDGLLRAGVPGVQLTWMDAKTGDHVVTPRIGKPVEIQALWFNALRIVGSRWSPQRLPAAARAQTAFLARFPTQSGGLFDVVDADHMPGHNDASLRPNQIFAVGGLPFPLLQGPAARAVVDQVEAHLLTPIGLRTLSPDDPAYIGHYRGDPTARDAAYHQGTVWPWLMGPFVDAWLRVRGDTAAARAEAATRFLPPLMAHLDQAGLGHVSEVADGDAPHTPGGCPFQAWSLGELIRLCELLKAKDAKARIDE